MPLHLELSTRRSPDSTYDHDALKIDWSHQFDSRSCRGDVWDERLIPASRLVAETIARYAPHKSVVARGMLGIPAAIVLGNAFSSIAGISLAWVQQSIEGESFWSISQPMDQVSVDVRVEARDLTGSGDIVALLSVTADVRNDVAPMMRQIRPRALVDVALPSPTQRLSAGEALRVAVEFVNAIRETRAKYAIRGTVHLFMAVPVGIAVMIGQLLNTLASVQTYEFDQRGSVPFHPSALLQIV
jgi:hypothetical protein